MCSKHVSGGYQLLLLTPLYMSIINCDEMLIDSNLNFSKMIGKALNIHAKGSN